LASAQTMLGFRFSNNQEHLIMSIMHCIAFSTA
jgi:hypothetical protein